MPSSRWLIGCLRSHHHRAVVVVLVFATVALAVQQHQKPFKAYQFSSSTNPVVIGRRHASHAVAIAERRREIDLEKLRSEHKSLADQIEALAARPGLQSELRGLKKRKLFVRDAMTVSSREEQSRPPLLGAGGCGCVYAAVDAATGAKVAVKIARGESGRRSLRREFQTLRRLAAGPFVCALDFREELRAEELDALNHEGLVSALVLERLGPSVEDVFWATTCGARGFKAVTWLKIAREVLTALAILAKLNIVHRDVQPGNMLFGLDNKVTLVDFGVATQLGEQPEEEEEEPCFLPFVGTPRFASAAAMMGRPPSAADDLESLVFSLAYLHRAKMPWPSSYDKLDSAASIKRLADAKQKLRPTDLLGDDPSTEVLAFLLETARETSDRAPDYLSCLRKVETVISAQSYRTTDNLISDWEEEGISWDDDGIHHCGQEAGLL